MASNPQLKNHLIRKLMDTIRHKCDGDAMVLLALSGKEQFSHFRFDVENFIYASTRQNSVSLEDLFFRSGLHFHFQTEGSEHLVIRFVRHLFACDAPTMPLPFEKITKFTIFKGYNKSFTPVLKSLTDLKVLTLDFYCRPIDDFFNEVNDGNISLTKLQKLDVRLSFDDLIKTMSTTPVFPLPQKVTFRFEIIDSVPDLVSLQTFPEVKHLVLDIWQDIEMTSAMLHHVSIVASCFTGLESAKMEFLYDRYVIKNAFAELVKFHESLRNTHFSFPVEVDYEKRVSLVYPESPKIVYEQLKSIGFKEDGRPGFFVFKREFGNVKLNHQIIHFEEYRPDIYEMYSTWLL